MNAPLAALATSLQLDLTPAADAVQTLLQNPPPRPPKSSSGGFKDALGNPFPPFAFGSSYEWDELDRLETKELGLLPKVITVANTRAPIRGGNPENPGQFSKTPGSGQREGETKAFKDSLGRFFDPEYPERFTAANNIARGKKAITRALSKKEDVRDAMYRPECGPIDFIWGTPGTKGEEIDRRDGFGISHAFIKHPNDIELLPEIIAKGTAYRVKSTGPDGKKRYYGRIAFVYGKRAIFVDPKPKGKSLVVTAYQKDDSGDLKKIEKNPKA